MVLLLQGCIGAALGGLLTFSASAPICVQTRPPAAEDASDSGPEASFRVENASGSGPEASPGT